MTPTEDLINEHKAIKVMLGIMNKIAILGTGSVGQTYASKFNTLGYDVMLGYGLK